MRKQIASTLLALAGLLPANAQYTFTISLSWSGKCSGYTAQMNQMMGKYKTQAINGFPTRELCEQTRAMCNQDLAHIELIWYDIKTGKEIKREATNCKFNATTSPCTGRPMAGSVGTLNALGVSQGTSFYSANTTNEVQHWSEDEAMRRMGLDKQFQNEKPTKVTTGDNIFDSARGKVFVPLNMRPGGTSTIISEDLIAPKVVPADEKTVAMYLDNVDWNTAPELPQMLNGDYLAWIKEQFKNVSGYDIDEILKTINRTRQQSEVLRNYREFEAKLLDEAKSKLDNLLAPIERSPEKKEVDMAILALDSYGNDDKGYLFNTDYKRVNLDKIALNDPMKELANKLASCNLTNYDTGFNAVLYYNDKANEYTLAFEGSAFPSFGKSSAMSTASKIALDFDFDMSSKEYVVNALGIEVRVPQDLWNDWGKNNALQAAGRMASQFVMANEIGNLIKSSPELQKLNINFVGHSLGGGLASVAGLSTGKPTYTYNAEGVSDKLLEKFGLIEKKNNKDYNITAYHTDNDILTNTQKWAQGEGKKSSTEIASEQAEELAVRMHLSELERIGYDTKTAKRLAGLAFDDHGTDYNVVAKIIDPENKKNDFVPTAIGNEVNMGDINTPKDKIVSGAVGIVAGGITLWATKDVDKSYSSVKKWAQLTDAALAHRMEPMAKNLMLKNVVQQNLWQYFNKEKQAMDREIGNTRMRSLEQIYVEIK